MHGILSSDIKDKFGSIITMWRYISVSKGILLTLGESNIISTAILHLMVCPRFAQNSCIFFFLVKTVVYFVYKYFVYVVLFLLWMLVFVINSS